MARTGISKLGLCVVVALFIASYMVFSASGARPLGLGGSGSPLTRGIEALLDGLYVEAIKSGGPSSGGKGHASTTYFTNSGPSQGGEGH
ncbi:hypothetical protein CDL15_Pgr014510 [Punica granatum]|uniref:Uncharacterized protein n=1 Tax=Punica granatum TaxID=22663 RepID=A0A218WD81_PUNGR|nr:hypothetical protein CDL15_Pgr014510 [Punica granatum]PKI79355.1 hypothetical protein CRG98_000233 [Punica granatum]